EGCAERKTRQHKCRAHRFHTILLWLVRVGSQKAPRSERVGRSCAVAADRVCHRSRPPKARLLGGRRPVPQLRAGRTTLTHGVPAARRRILSAIVCLRRWIVPAVQPDMCGVITTLASSWNGSFDGSVVALPGEG